MKKAKRNNSLYAILFIAPFFILFSVFCIWPVIQGVYVSFHKWSIMGKQAFVGFDNYVKFFSDENFWQSLGNTTFFVVITAPILVIVAMVLALLANRPTRLKKFFRISYYLPSILSVAVGSFIAKYMFSPYNGFINGVLTSLGFLKNGEVLLWTQDLGLAWATISSMTIWWTLGFSLMIFISALQDISIDVMEAASIDGASKFQQLIHITLPLLKPTTFLITLLQIIGCFKVFGQIFLITGGGPSGKTRPLIQYIYEAGFVKSKMGYASAMSYALFFILVVLCLLQLYLQKRSEEK